MWGNSSNPAQRHCCDKCFWGDRWVQRRRRHRTPWQRARNIKMDDPPVCYSTAHNWKLSTLPWSALTDPRVSSRWPGGRNRSAPRPRSTNLPNTPVPGPCRPLVVMQLIFYWPDDPSHTWATETLAKPERRRFCLVLNLAFAEAQLRTRTECDKFCQSKYALINELAS